MTSWVAVTRQTAAPYLGLEGNAVIEGVEL